MLQIKAGLSRPQKEDETLNEVDSFSSNEEPAGPKADNAERSKKVAQSDNRVTSIPQEGGDKKNNPSENKNYTTNITIAHTNQWPEEAGNYVEKEEKDKETEFQKDALKRQCNNIWQRPAETLLSRKRKQRICSMSFGNRQSKLSGQSGDLPTENQTPKNTLISKPGVIPAINKKKHPMKRYYLKRDCGHIAQKNKSSTSCHQLQENLSEKSSLTKRDSWIWFKTDHKEGLDTFSSRQREFQSTDPRVAHLAAEINRQEALNQDIIRKAQSLQMSVADGDPENRNMGKYYNPAVREDCHSYDTGRSKAYHAQLDRIASHVHSSHSFPMSSPPRRHYGPYIGNCGEDSCVNVPEHNGTQSEKYVPACPNVVETSLFTPMPSDKWNIDDSCNRRMPLEERSSYDQEFINDSLKTRNLLFLKEQTMWSNVNTGTHGPSKGQQTKSYKRRQIPPTMNQEVDMTQIKHLELRSGQGQGSNNGNHLYQNHNSRTMPTDDLLSNSNTCTMVPVSSCDNRPPAKPIFKRSEDGNYLTICLPVSELNDYLPGLKLAHSSHPKKSHSHSFLEGKVDAAQKQIGSEVTKTIHNLFFDTELSSSVSVSKSPKMSVVRDEHRLYGRDQVPPKSIGEMAMNQIFSSTHQRSADNATTDWSAFTETFSVPNPMAQESTDVQVAATSQNLATSSSNPTGRVRKNVFSREYYLGGRALNRLSGDIKQNQMPATSRWKMNARDRSSNRTTSSPNQLSTMTSTSTSDQKVFDPLQWNHVKEFPTCHETSPPHKMKRFTAQPFSFSTSPKSERNAWAWWDVPSRKISAANSEPGGHKDSFATFSLSNETPSAVTGNEARSITSSHDPFILRNVHDEFLTGIDPAFVQSRETSAQPQLLSLRSHDSISLSLDYQQNYDSDVGQPVFISQSTNGDQWYDDIASSSSSGQICHTYTTNFDLQ